ncbi:MAG: roadblock/LC7 domain-containing protein [Fibrobacterales bacterium]|nr:roadblock/LC7 domain-containing protein [Fibrobacterales bacterium]MBP5189072.1 roadblock/LC7 domain-containing protein [Fibrobacterales bacterium]
MSDMVISPNAAYELQEKLQQVYELSTASYLLLSHVSGTPISDAGTLENGDSSVFCALSAAAWSSGTSMAKIITEPSCRSLNLIGHNRVVHIVPVGDNALLVFVFSSEVLPKGFRMLAWKWADEVAAAMGGFGSSSKIGQ